MDPFLHILNRCIPAECTEVLMIMDEFTEVFKTDVLDAAAKAGKKLTVCTIPGGSKHGQEPPQDVVDRMFYTQAIMCMTRYSLAHTDARFRTEKKGIPFLSMPGYSMDMIDNPALTVDYQSAYPAVNYYANLLSNGNKITITSGSGTELYIDVTGRTGNCCPGYTDTTHLLGSPPDIEANIAPLESYTHGVIVVDGSITDDRVGILSTPVRLSIENGAVTDIECSESEIRNTLIHIFDDVGSPNAYVVGELGIGFNDRAILCGNMLIDEGTRGCIHFGIGSNWTIGGANKVDFHLDFVVKDTNVDIDGNMVIKEGKLLYE